MIKWRILHKLGLLKTYYFYVLKHVCDVYQIGVLGFSQGACFLSILCALREQGMSVFLTVQSRCNPLSYHEFFINISWSYY